MNVALRIGALEDSYPTARSMFSPLAESVPASGRVFFATRYAVRVHHVGHRGAFLGRIAEMGLRIEARSGLCRGLSRSLLNLAECGGSASYYPFTAARRYRH